MDQLEGRKYCVIVALKKIIQFTICVLVDCIF